MGKRYFHHGDICQHIDWIPDSRLERSQKYDQGTDLDRYYALYRPEFFLFLSFLAFIFNASKMEYLALTMATQSEIIPRPYFAHTVAGFLGFCLVASLKFMWDERAKNGE